MKSVWDSGGEPASLVWMTPNAEATIAYIARVSSDWQENPEYLKLFRYLVKHGHWSPFEHAVACVEINTTRAIAAQILRHRSFSFQEFSQRYQTVKDRPVMGEQRLKGSTNRQGSVDWNLGNATIQQASAADEGRKAVDAAWTAYRKMVDAGFAPETARNVLPLCTPTRMYMTGSIRSWIHYLKLRLDPTTQEEHRKIAEAIRDVLDRDMPNIMKLTGLNEV